MSCFYLLVRAAPSFDSVFHCTQLSRLQYLRNVPTSFLTRHLQVVDVDVCLAYIASRPLSNRERAVLSDGEVRGAQSHEQKGR